MRNAYKGTCYRCGKQVEPNGGHFEKVYSDRLEKLKFPRGPARWLVQHDACAIRWRGTYYSTNNQIEEASDDNA